MNIIKARFLRDCKPYGMEYSYLIQEPVAVGDLVQAETQRGVADLIVTAVNVPEEEVQKFKDRLKFIIGKKPEGEELKRTGMDIEVKEFQAPKIIINYETLKAELEKNLQDYKGLVVTEQTLAGSKAAQKELASLRVKIDTYRKAKKKEIEKPIKAFEAQCKELIALVENVEQPIKDAIKIFDDKKREEKRNIALELIAEVAAEIGLNEKYTAKLDVLDKYTNLTAAEKSVRDDLETRAFALKVEQDREVERLEIINSVLESENSRLKTKMKINMWLIDINSGVQTHEIINKIKAQAELIYEAENQQAEPPKEAEPTPEPPKAEKAEETPQQYYSATYKITGTVEQLRSVSAFLKEYKISYEVLEQREV